MTLTGALAEGVTTLDSTYSGKSPMKIGNAPVTNFEGGSYGRVDVKTATMRSINTVFAQMAVEMGPEALVSQADAYGFDREYGYELPVKTSLMPDPAEMTTWETAWAGVGQPVGEHDSPPGPQATVMQMALVAAGIANDGVVMRPHVIDSVVAPNGQVTSRTPGRRLTTATDSATAHQVRDVMIATVEAGSGTRARVPGVEVAGKTGTAESGKSRTTDAWFIAFAPAKDPTVALAVLIEEGGVGGRVAAPAAQPVLRAALKAQEAAQ